MEGLGILQKAIPVILALLFVIGLLFLVISLPTTPSQPPPGGGVVVTEGKAGAEQPIEEEPQRSKPLINPLILTGILILIFLLSVITVAIKLRDKYMIFVERGSVLYAENRLFGTGRWAGPGAQFMIPIFETVEDFPGADVEIFIPEYAVHFKEKVGVIPGKLDVRAVLRIFNVARLVGTLAREAEDSGQKRVPWRKFARNTIRGIVYGTAREHSFLEVNAIEESCKRQITTELERYGIGLGFLDLENADVDPRYREALQEQAIADLNAGADRTYLEQSGLTPMQMILLEAAKKGGFFEMLLAGLAGRYVAAEQGTPAVPSPPFPTPAVLFEEELEE